MKKTLLYMAIAAAALVLSACGGKVDPDDPNNTDDNEYVAPIAIDGDFSDWAKIDNSLMATAKNEEGASHEALKLVKVYADEVYVYVYFEWNKEFVEHGADELVPFHIYVNGDGDSLTGGFADQFEDACIDLLMEGFLFDENGKVASYDPGCFKWVGETNGSGWEWEDVESGAGFCQGAGVEGKYELAITRELYPLGKLADTFSIGFDIQQAWDSVGILPNSADGTAPTLQVTTVKSK